MNKKLVSLFMSVAILSTLSAPFGKDFNKNNFTNPPQKSAQIQVKHTADTSNIFDSDSANEIKESLEKNLSEKVNEDINLKALRKQKLRKIAKSSESINQ